MSAVWPDDRPTKPRLRLSERGYTVLCALWVMVSAGLFAAITVTGPGNGWVTAGIVVETVGTVCYLMAAMRP